MGRQPGLPLYYRLSFLALLLLFLALGIAGVDASCLDAADSTYIISADAVARGLAPYKDFLAAHPPMLFLLGAPLAKLGAGVIPFRVFSLVIMATLGLAVWQLAFRLSGSDLTALIAGGLALFAPLGIFFSKLYLNDPLISLLAVVTVILLLKGSRGSTAAAAVLCVLGILTKLTWLPLLAVFSLYIIIYRRERAGVFLAVALGGTVAATFLVDLVSGGAYLGDILGAQASKGYSFTNFYEGLHRIWQMDWPLIVVAPAGLWFGGSALWRQRPGGELFLLAGWLGAGLLMLAILPAEGHDTNLFLVAEPALALLAARGIAGIAARAGNGERRSLAAALMAAAWLVLAVPAMVDADRTFSFRSNATDVDVIAGELQAAAPGGEPVLAPGCFALAAERPVAANLFDPFLWGRKYNRGDSDAVELAAELQRDLAEQALPALVFEGEGGMLEPLRPALEANYEAAYKNREWPDVTLWLPKGE